MDSRREFLKKAALLSGAAGITSILPPSIQRAFAINPDAGTTFLDAEHVVILMQENRSFDHCYGTLQGVRGFNDPRAITLPSQNKVWLQTNSKGETFAPFRLNIKGTKATWMGSLPHGWTDQVDVRNGGRHDQWLDHKKSGYDAYKDMPLTMGFYNREDIPFYYSLADAFTVCDQNFCSSLTGTTPNRLHLWTGTVRENLDSPVVVRNEEADSAHEVKWRTFPELLEENNISWKIYQNEIGFHDVGFAGEEDPWLANFGDNPIECFEQFKVRFHPAHRKQVAKRITQLPEEIRDIETKLNSLKEGSDEFKKLTSTLGKKQREWKAVTEESKKYTAENYAMLSQREKNIHEKAFVTNINDPAYHELATLKYQDGSTDREMQVPKGDVLHQFREDVKNGKLPAVSWLVAPENFSDHPTSPWYGAWYLSESLDILTQNEEVWRKTIFILCYDENDGYFDHVPPFIPPDPEKTGAGLASAGIDTRIEHVTLEMDLKKKDASHARGGAIGLGYRVPLVIASPWSRGGAVCSEIYDHTSILKFLEHFLSHKTGKKIEESNISSWRRTVCGDLTATFKPYQGEKISLPEFVSRDEFVESIHKAQFMPGPSGFHALSKAETDQANQNPAGSVLPRQEKGMRASRALPYQLYADGKMADDKFEIRFEVRKEVFGEKTAGSPFYVYSLGKDFTVRNYAVKPGDKLEDSWSAGEFENGNVHLKAYGPNGFFREFKAKAGAASAQISCDYEKSGKQLTGNVELTILNPGATPLTIAVKDNAYNQPPQTKTIAGHATVKIILNLSKSFGWYDTSVVLQNSESRFAGRVETGKESMTDPAMA